MKEFQPIFLEKTQLQDCSIASLETPVPLGILTILRYHKHLQKINQQHPERNYHQL